MYKKALISVSDKRGLEELLRPLVRKGLKLSSTGGTAKFLRSKGFEVQDTAGLTSFPSALSGRVKTLHPHIYIPLLARNWLKEDQELLNRYRLKPFDLVIGNLYPFEEKSEKLKGKELAEWIDVGGPGLLRAAAKNYFSVTAVCCPEDYPKIQEGTDLKQRRLLAAKVFKRLSLYDSLIAERLNREGETGFLAQKRGAKGKSAARAGRDFSLKGRFFKNLRYGENPHQKAQWLVTEAQGLHSAQILQGKELSYNNLLDFCAAVLAARDFEEPFAVAIKHNSPCGAGLAKSAAGAAEKAIQADPLSVFGGLLALNRPVDQPAAEKLKDIFLEGLIAPDFSSSALSALKSKKNLRILRWPEMLSAPLPSQSFREIIGGFLIQSGDQAQRSWPEGWRAAGAEPSEKTKRDLLFAWKICAHLKSNAIATVKDGQTLGLGMGQVSRVSAVRLALEQARRFHPSRKELILASDGFFPFPDSIDLAFKGGVSWIIQPGGSIRDEKILRKAKKLGLNMILTGQRRFRH